MNRKYLTPAVAPEWADTRETDMAVATAIHAISASERTPEAIWDAPTREEWDHVVMAIEEYVRHGDFAANPAGYFWGQEVVQIEPEDGEPTP